MVHPIHISNIRKNGAVTRKPLPLKQRTASIDQRRDFNQQTIWSLLTLLKIREIFITVDHFSIWQRHVAWAMDDGNELRSYMTQRYASSMVFMSLLLSTELSLLFNSAGVTTEMRHALQQEQYNTAKFWAGISIIVSTIFALLSLVSIFTAWTMVSAISTCNVHCIFRSSIGQYVSHLPGRFIVISLYSFLLTITIFVFLLMPVGVWSTMLLALMVGLFIHTIIAFSAFGRVIMHTGAMGTSRIFEKSYESGLLPHSLHANLLAKAKTNLGNNTSIRRQYLSKAHNKPMTRMYSEDEMSGQLGNDRSVIGTPPSDVATAVTTPSSSSSAQPQRERVGSLVKFSDGYDTNGDRYDDETTNRQFFDSSNTKDISCATQSTGARNDEMINTAIGESGLHRPPRPQQPLQRQQSGNGQFDDHFAVVESNNSDREKMTQRWLNSSSNEDLSVLDDDSQHHQFIESILVSNDEQQQQASNDNNTRNSNTILSGNPYALQTNGIATTTPQHAQTRNHSMSMSSMDDDSSVSKEQQQHNLRKLSNDTFDEEYGSLFDGEEEQQQQQYQENNSISNNYAAPSSQNNKRNNNHDGTGVNPIANTYQQQPQQHTESHALLSTPAPDSDNRRQYYTQSSSSPQPSSSVTRNFP